MPRIDELFKLHTATATGFVHYSPGPVAYITNGTENNGVVGFVKAKKDDEVFSFVGIAVSAFGDATVQLPPFIARGNGGSGLIVLEPINRMTVDQLGYVAAYINTQIRWRFSWSRVVTLDRFKHFNIPSIDSPNIKYQVSSLLPAQQKEAKLSWKPRFSQFSLESLFSLKAGDYHNASELPEGDFPLISCGDSNNGITAFVDVPDDRLHSNKLTIAFNGMNTLAAKYHPYNFAAKDDVAVCTPLKELRTETIFFIQLMLSREN